jgi:hypothetical protein
MASEIRRLRCTTLFGDDFPQVNRNSPSSKAPIVAGHRSDRTAFFQPADAQDTIPIPLEVHTTHEHQGSVPIRSGSPWTSYEKIHQRNLVGGVAVVVKLPAKKEDYMVKRVSGDDTQGKLLNVRGLRHENLLKTLEIFDYDDGFDLITEPMCISLRHVCRYPGYPSEKQLSTIVKQVRISPVPVLQSLTAVDSRRHMLPHFAKPCSSFSNYRQCPHQLGSRCEDWWVNCLPTPGPVADTSSKHRGL